MKPSEIVDWLTLSTDSLTNRSVGLGPLDLFKCFHFYFQKKARCKVLKGGWNEYLATKKHTELTQAIAKSYKFPEEISSVYGRLKCCAVKTSSKVFFSETKKSMSSI